MITLIELYNLKLNEYKSTGVRERPCKLLAMLLLSEKSKYEPLKVAEGQFYEYYKEEIAEGISKVERDFDFTKEELIKEIEKTVECDNYEQDKIWYVFSEGFSVLHWGLMYHNNETPEEIYSKYFDDNQLKRHYNIEEKAVANNVKITRLDDLLNKFIESPNEFYKKICDNLTVEERIFILKNIENKDCTTCLNGSCRVEASEKIGVDEFGNPEGYDCVGWYNAELIGKSKVLKIGDVRKLK